MSKLGSQTQRCNGTVEQCAETRLEGERISVRGRRICSEMKEQARGARKLLSEVEVKCEVECKCRMRWGGMSCNCWLSALGSSGRDHQWLGR